MSFNSKNLSTSNHNKITNDNYIIYFTILCKIIIIGYLHAESSRRNNEKLKTKLRSL